MESGESRIRIRCNEEATANMTDNEMAITMTITVKFPMPAQSEQLPFELEKIVDEAGQQFKREFYKYSIMAADKQLVAEQKQAGNIWQRGRKSYTFKTKFGVVKVGRIRVSAKDGGTEIPSSRE